MAAVSLRNALCALLFLFGACAPGFSQSGSRTIVEPGPAPIINAGDLPSASTTINSPLNGAVDSAIDDAVNHSFVRDPSIPLEGSVPSTGGVPAEGSTWEACTCPACEGDPGAESCTSLPAGAGDSCTAPGGDCGCGGAGNCECGPNCGCGKSCGLGLFGGCKCGLCGKEEAKKPAPKKDEKPTCKGSHKPLFYLNDFSYLNNPKYDGCCLGDRFKQIKLGGCGCGSPTCADPCCCPGGAGGGKGGGPVLDLGGQVRLRGHYERGMGQQAGFTRFQNTENQFGLLRLRLYSNLKLTDNVRIFAEGIYADVVGSNDAYVPRGPIDRNWGDINNLFIDLKLTNNTTARFGRQEIVLGAQRLISPLDWANTRRRFDGVRITNKWDKLTLDSFYLNFVPVVFDEFDDFFQDNSKLYGTYGSYKGAKDTFELYYMGNDNDAGNFSLHTIGSRMIGGRENWLYELEGGVQLGDQDGRGLAHEAAFGTAGIGRKFPKGIWSPTVWFYYDYASGNNLGGDFNGFNQYFPLAHKYLGFIDAVARNNVESPNILLTLQPGKKTKLLFWYYHLMANQDTAAVPAIGGTPAQSLVSKDLGNEIDVLLSHNIGPRSNLVLGYSRFFRGNKILTDTDADFGYAQWTLNF